MKHYTLTRFNSLVRVVEVDPTKQIIQIVKADSTRQPLRDFKHAYHNRHGYKEIFKINGASTFDMANPKSLFYGELFYDGGHDLGEHSDKMTEFYFTKDHRLYVEGDINFKVPENPSLGQSGLFALTVNGKKNTYNMKKYAHYNTKTVRAGMGQKLDGVVGFVRANNLTGDEFADLMLELGFINSVNFDGGGSGQMQIGDTHYGSSRLLGTAIVVLAKDEPKKEAVQQNDKDPILIIDPGHGGKDPGGGSSIFYDPNGFYEKDMVLDISLYQYERFRELGVPVALTRKTDVYLSPEDRTNIVKASGAKYCISNHVNAASDPKARGAETIHSIHSNGRTAIALLEAIVAEGMAKRRVFFRKNDNGSDWYFMHRLTGSVETTIDEFGFATNETDARLIAQNWKRYAESNVKAFCQLIGHAYSPPNEIKPEPAPTPLPERSLNRLIVDGKQVGAYRDQDFLLENLKVALDNKYKDILIQRV